MVFLLGMLCWGVGGVWAAQAQVEGGAKALTSRERPARIVLKPTYQRFEEGGQTVTQWSIPLVAVVPFGDRWKATLRGSGASAGGEDLQTLSGLADVRVGLSYAQPIGEGSLVVNANVNAPTGKAELTPGEFETARLLSRNFFQFRVPSFGQGLGAGTGATWAVPVTESVVIGIGGAFRYHGSYTPTAGQDADYDPGEEGRITGGVDVRLGKRSALSADGSFYVYGTDTVGGVDEFEAGNQFAVRVQYLREEQVQSVRIVGYYRNQEKSTLPIRDEADRTLQVLPTRGLLRGEYRRQLARSLALHVSVAGRWYDETVGEESKTLATLGVEPRFSVGDRFQVAPRGAYTAGDVSGFEGGIGLTAQF
jgi:hypothetical protein